ncbi:MAG: transposase [Nitrososphaerota archaeon]|nr:transposase [Nitrososphaerota archaeon]
MKTQIIANAQTKDVIAIAQSYGSKHDFELFKENFDGCLKGVLFLADRGYRGILELYLNSKTPVKCKNNQKLSKKEKACNRDLSMQRIFIEHVNAWIKRFKILKYTYRNKRKRHGLRVSLICGIDLLRNCHFFEVTDAAYHVEP